MIESDSMPPHWGSDTAPRPSPLSPPPPARAVYSRSAEVPLLRTDRTPTTPTTDATAGELTPTTATRVAQRCHHAQQARRDCARGPLETNETAEISPLHRRRRPRPPSNSSPHHHCHSSPRTIAGTRRHSWPLSSGTTMVGGSFGAFACALGVMLLWGGGGGGGRTAPVYGVDAASGFVNGAWGSARASRFGECRANIRKGGAKASGSSIEARCCTYSFQLNARGKGPAGRARGTSDTDSTQFNASSKTTAGHQHSLSRDKRLLTDKLKRALRPDSSLFKTSTARNKKSGSRMPVSRPVDPTDPLRFLSTSQRQRLKLGQQLSPSSELRSASKNPPQHPPPPLPAATSPSPGTSNNTSRSTAMPASKSGGPAIPTPLPSPGKMPGPEHIQCAALNGARGKLSMTETDRISATGATAEGLSAIIGGSEGGVTEAAVAIPGKSKGIRMRQFVPGRRTTSGEDDSTNASASIPEGNGEGEAKRSMHHGAGRDSRGSVGGRAKTSRRAKKSSTRVAPTEESDSAFREYVFAGVAGSGRGGSGGNGSGRVITGPLDSVIRVLSEPPILPMPPPRSQAEQVPSSNVLPSSTQAAVGCVGPSETRAAASGSAAGMSPASNIAYVRAKRSLSVERDRWRRSGSKPKTHKIAPPSRAVQIKWSPGGEAESPLSCITLNTDMFGEALSPRVARFTRAETAAYLQKWILAAAKHGVVPRELQTLLPDEFLREGLDYPDMSDTSLMGDEGDVETGECGALDSPGSDSGGARGAGSTAVPWVDSTPGASWRTYGWRRFHGSGSSSSSSKDEAGDHCTGKEHDEEAGGGSGDADDDEEAEELEMENMAEALVGSGEQRVDDVEAEDGGGDSDWNRGIENSGDRLQGGEIASGSSPAGGAEDEDHAVEGGEKEGVEVGELGWRVLEAVEERHSWKLHPPRIIAIGDVHGCIDELKDLVKKVEYWPGDLLVFLGDLVAKGPDSAGVVGMARELGGVTVRGNHEFEVLRMLTMDGANAAAGRTNTNTNHQAIAQTLSEADAVWMVNSPWYFECPQLEALFVHAGFVSGTKLAHQNPRLMMNMRSVSPDGAVTSKHLEDGAWASLWKGPQTVFFGHDAWRGLQLREHAVGLDTGCVYGGRLTACILPDRRLVSVESRESYIRFKKHREVHEHASADPSLSSS